MIFSLLCYKKYFVIYYYYRMDTPQYTKGGIPKIIHQTWKNHTIPDKWMQSHTEWQRLHPDWIYTLWTDEAIRQHIATYHPQFLSLHDSYDYPIQRADMIRYFILYDYGGIYSDLDLYPVQNIEPYLDMYSDYFVYSANSDCFTNAFMISRKKSPIWLDVFNELPKPAPYWAWGKHLRVMTTTGPYLLDRVLKDTKHTYSVLPKSLFNPYSVADDLHEIKQNVCIRTLEGSSWHSWDSRLYNVFFRNKNFFICFGVIALLLVLVGFIYFIIKYKSSITYTEKVLEYCDNVCVPQLSPRNIDIT